jgi:hypothetical protein
MRELTVRSSFMAMGALAAAMAKKVDQRANRSGGETNQFGERSPTNMRRIG